MTSAVRDLGSTVSERNPLHAPFVNACVLVITSDSSLVEAARVVLGDHGYTVNHATPDAVASALSNRDVDVVLIDTSTSEPTTAIAAVREASPASCVVAVCAPAVLDHLVEMLASGATDFVLQPIEAIAVRTLTTVNQALSQTRLARENRRMLQRLATEQPTSGLIGCSAPHRRMLGAISRAAESDATVLVEGKPGSGKSTVVETIHRGSRRAHRPLIVRSAEGLGADGLELAVQEAHTGVLVLEDIDRLPADAQSRLVRFLKDRREGVRNGEARLIATTNARLPELVARGVFREDLFYRINVLPIGVPSLSERRDDVALLAHHFLKTAAENTGVDQHGFTPAALTLLEATSYANNIAQLNVAIQRAHALAGSNPIDRQHLGATDAVPAAAPTAHTRVEEAETSVDEADIKPFKDEEKRLLSRALRATGGNVRRAAQLLRIGRATLYRKIQSYRLRLY